MVRRDIFRRISKGKQDQSEQFEYNKYYGYDLKRLTTTFEKIKQSHIISKITSFAAYLNRQKNPDSDKNFKQAGSSS